MRSTNQQIANLVRNMASASYKADVPVYSKENINFYANFPTQYANEFLEILTNKIVISKTLTMYRENDFEWFRKDDALFGDTEEYIGVMLQDTKDYGHETNPFNADKPTLKNYFVHTTYKKVWSMKTSIEILRGAFVNEYGLANLTAELMNALQSSRSMFIYDKFIDFFNAAIKNNTNLQATQLIELQPITEEGDTATVQANFEKVFGAIKRLYIPSNKYNEAKIRQQSLRNDICLIINTAYQSSFDVNVFASLPNSDKIGLDSIIAHKIEIDGDLTLSASGEKKVVAIAIDRWGFILKNRILEMRTQQNAAMLELNYWYHNWIIMSYLPLKNMLIFHLPQGE